MEIKRHIVVQAIKTRENELIPIWDERIIFEKTEMYGNAIKLKGDYNSNHYNLIECVYDLKTKKLDLGVEFDYYPTEEELEFKVGEVVLFEKSLRKLVETKISEVVYEQYDLEIKKGKKFDAYWRKLIKGIEIDDNSLYALKVWKPFYILDDGTKVEWSHKLYHKIENVSDK